MTEDNMQVLRDDLAFMRDLADDGSNAPLLFGGVMVAAGLILALYGAAWFVAGEMSRQGWLKLVALAAFIGAVVLGALASGPHLMLAYAACLVLVAVVPGIVLMRPEPAGIA